MARKLRVQYPGAIYVSFLALAVFTIVCGPGCKSSSPSQYISPRIVGRVLDNRTHQPIQDVQVWRTDGVVNNPDPSSLKGGQRMVQEAPARTGSDGRFVLDSERALTFFRELEWYSINVSFKHPGYELFTATFPLSSSTNTLSGEPVVNTGDILLIPLTK